MSKQKIIQIDATIIRIYSEDEAEFISLTDIAKRFNEESPAALVGNWMRNKDTVEFLGTWEALNNPNFNLLEFEEVKNESGSNRFVLSPTRWAGRTGAVGVQTKSGRHGGGTFAHRDIAMAFCYWLSPSFQLYVLKEFQRLKTAEAAEQKLSLGWDIRRELSKINYFIHTDAVQQFLIPPRIANSRLENLYFSSEADLLNLAVFGLTARQWRKNNPEIKGNLRDHASTEQLLVLANLESINSEFIRQGLDKEARLQRLNEIAIYQLQILLAVKTPKKLGSENFLN